MVALARLVEPGALQGIEKPRRAGMAPKVSEGLTRSQSDPSARSAYRQNPLMGPGGGHAMGDTMYGNSLKHLLKPELHGVIEPWLKQAMPIDKKSMQALDRMAQPRLIARMGRPADVGRPQPQS